MHSRSICEYGDSIFLQNWLDHENISSPNYSGGQSVKVIPSEISTSHAIEGKFEAILQTEAASLRQKDAPFENGGAYAPKNIDLEAGIYLAYHDNMLQFPNHIKMYKLPTSSTEKSTIDLKRV
jgi:hypothetical protein